MSRDLIGKHYRSVDSRPLRLDLSQVIGWYPDPQIGVMAVLKGGIEIHVRCYLYEFDDHMKSFIEDKAL